MSPPISLKEAERRAFLTITNDGLWDIFLGCFFSMFAIAPFLSARLGDFWASFVFLPVWGLVYLAIWLLRKYVVIPRVGSAKYGPARKTKLMRLTVVMLVINILTLILGFVALATFGRVPGQMYSIFIGLILLIGFSLAAYCLDFSRLYFYGLLVGIAPFLGEWLWNLGYVSHHGFPLTFGAISVLMVLIGLIVFINLLRHNPVPVAPEA